MRTIIAILSIALASCAVTIHPDGSKEVTVDAVALGSALTAYGQSKTPKAVEAEK